MISFCEDVGVLAGAGMARMVQIPRLLQALWGKTFLVRDSPQPARKVGSEVHRGLSKLWTVVQCLYEALPTTQTSGQRKEVGEAPRRQLGTDAVGKDEKVMHPCSPRTVRGTRV